MNEAGSRCFSGILLLSLWSNEYWQFDLWFLRLGLPSGTSGKESACWCKRPCRSTPGSEGSLGVGNGNLLQYSCLEKFHGQRTLVGYLPWGSKELEMTETLRLYSRSLHSSGISSSIYCLKHQLNKPFLFKVWFKNIWYLRALLPPLRNWRTVSEHTHSTRARTHVCGWLQVIENKICQVEQRREGLGMAHRATGALENQGGKMTRKPKGSQLRVRLGTVCLDATTGSFLPFDRVILSEVKISVRWVKF